MSQTRIRPQTLPSTTTRFATEHGHLYITISEDEHGQPFEVFGTLGKVGGPHYGATELACRLVSLHLRCGTPLSEIVEQCQGVGGMQPWPNSLDGISTVYIHGVGDAIAYLLDSYRGVDLGGWAHPPQSR